VIGVVIGSILVAFLNHHLSTEEMHSYGWRIPFLISVIGSIVGVYIRSHLSDPGVYLKVKARRNKESVPLKDLFLNHKAKIGTIVLLDFLTAVGFFVLAIFLVSYFKIYLHVSEITALSIHTFNMFVFAGAILLGGWLSDKIGRKPVLGLPCIGFILFSYPLFQMLQTGDLTLLIASQAALVFMFGLFFGTIPTTLAEIMPTDVRFSGLSIGRNICMAVIGGGAPFLATHMIQTTNDLSSPAYLLVIAAVVSFGSLWFIKDRYRSSLD
jgi:MHS family proline/betaine transporter-like MFS transporter